MLSTKAIPTAVSSFENESSSLFIGCQDGTLLSVHLQDSVVTIEAALRFHHAPISSVARCPWRSLAQRSQDRSFDLGSVADGVFRLDDGAVASVGDFTAAVRTGCGNDVRGGRAMESGEPAGVRGGGGRRRAAAVAAGEESERRGGGEVRRRRQSCRCRWEERKRDEGRVGSRDCGGATMGDGCGWVWKTVGVSEGSKRKVACVRMT